MKPKADSNQSEARTNSGMGRTLRLFVAVVVIGAAVALGLSWLPQIDASSDEAAAPEAAALIHLAKDRTNAVTFPSSEAMRTLGILVAPVKSAPPPDPLRLPGSLFLDPNRIVRVHSRFTGEVVSIGNAADTKRSLRYGDRVSKGQVLTSVWSKDIGEKKSELIDALAKLENDRKLLQKYETAERGVIPEIKIFEARRNVEAGMIAVAKAERTLRSWRLTEEDIEAVRREVAIVQQRGVDIANLAAERNWAETEIRSAIDGVIVEKNFNVGDIVDPLDDLFKIADLGQLQVAAHIYEEDLPAVQSLPPTERHWTIDLKADPHDEPIPGVFELIGNVIDPAQRTGLLLGWVNNSSGKLLVGQFITATVELPADPGLVAVPERAVIEEGSASMVFVEVEGAVREFVRRKVAVIRRGRNLVFISANPAAHLAATGCEPLVAGERVISSGALQVGSELSNLQSSMTASRTPAKDHDPNASQSESE